MHKFKGKLFSAVLAVLVFGSLAGGFCSCAHAASNESLLIRPAHSCCQGAGGHACSGHSCLHESSISQSEITSAGFEIPKTGTGALSNASMEPVVRFPGQGGSASVFPAVPDVSSSPLYLLLQTLLL